MLLPLDCDSPCLLPHFCALRTVMSPDILKFPALLCFLNLTVLRFPAFCASWTKFSSFFVLRELKSPQDPILFCTSSWYKSSEFPAFLCMEKLPRPKNTAFCASWTSHVSNVQHLCASAASHFQALFFAFGNPILWLREMGPFLFAFFPLFRSHFWSIWSRSLWCSRLWSCWFFPCFVGILAVYGPGPNSPFVLFGPHHGPFYTPKTLRFEGKMSNVDAIKTIKLGKTSQKDKWFHSHACTSHYTHVFQCFCAPGTHTTKKSPSLPCASLEPKLRNKSIRIYSSQLPETCNRCWCAIDVGESSVQFLRN